MYSPRQKSWPVAHKINEKTFRKFQKCIFWLTYIKILVSGHSPLLFNDFQHPSGHAGDQVQQESRLPGLDGVEGVGLCKGEDPPQGPLRHLELFPDIAERNLGPPELNCSPFVFVFQAFPCYVFYCSLPETGLESAKDLLLCKRLPNEKFLS
jgi:hypothetical protein